MLARAVPPMTTLPTSPGIAVPGQWPGPSRASTGGSPRRAACRHRSWGSSAAQLDDRLRGIGVGGRGDRLRRLAGASSWWSCWSGRRGCGGGGGGRGRRRVVVVLVDVVGRQCRRRRAAGGRRSGRRSSSPPWYSRRGRCRRRYRRTPSTAASSPPRRRRDWARRAHVSEEPPLPGDIAPSCTESSTQVDCLTGTRTPLLSSQCRRRCRPGCRSRGSWRRRDGSRPERPRCARRGRRGAAGTGETADPAPDRYVGRLHVDAEVPADLRDGTRRRRRRRPGDRPPGRRAPTRRGGPRLVGRQWAHFCEPNDTAVTRRCTGLRHEVAALTSTRPAGPLPAGQRSDQDDVGVLDRGGPRRHPAPPSSAAPPRTGGRASTTASKRSPSTRPTAVVCLERDDEPAGADTPP